jgi:hypothetical protein
VSFVGMALPSDNPQAKQADVTMPAAGQVPQYSSGE